MRVHRALIAFLLLALAGAPGTAQTIINVPDDYDDIQTAIGHAVSGDIILVAPGTYYGVNNRSIEFFGKAITLRSTDGPGATILTGSAADRVFYIHGGEGRDTVVEGFTITNGLAPGASNTYGGGIYIDETAGGAGSSPTIRNCVIRISSATNGGGVAVRGGGSNPLFDSCFFHTNDAVTGGAMHILYHAEVRNSRFLSNLADNGGAVYLGATGPMKFINCRFILNEAERGGAVFSISYANTVFRNCLFDDNYARQGPGTDDGCGGAIYGGENADFQFCTFSGNGSYLFGKTLYANSNHTGQEFHNSILWDSSTNSVVAVQPVVYQYNDIREPGLGDPGDGNFTEDPQFVVGPAEDGTFYLSPISQCVDAGNVQASAVYDIGALFWTALDSAATRTDYVGDSGVADLGFHYFHPVFYDGFDTGDSSQWSYR